MNEEQFIINAKISFCVSAKDSREAILKATQALYDSPKVAWDWGIEEIKPAN